MIALELRADPSVPLQILCLGCHSDDIEIGCGGTILRLRKQYPTAIFHWVVFSATGIRAAEARKGAELFGGDAVFGGPKLKAFRDGFMPFVGAEVKDVFEDLKRSVSPDLVLTHNRQDSHQDHRLIAELTWNTFRNHFILEYEIPKYDGDLGQPSFFVPLETETCQRKVENLMACFQSQGSKRWFHPEIFFGFMRLRGMECNAPSGYAEAFYCRKLLL
jgi:LmbE family N-acetylglucosaminyl deacetylase